MPHEIELRQVSHRFRRGGPLILDGVTFAVARAERVAIIGRSGCGKSTLLQIVAGLARSSGGEVLVAGVQVTAPSPRCTLMFQRPLLFPWLTIAQNVALALRFANRSTEVASRVGELLRLVGLSGYESARVHELSGGQQQRAALARSLAVDPAILLLDEPFSALDAVTRAELRGEIRAILDTLSITFMLVTHDVADALDLAERVIVMAAAPGRIVADIRLPMSTDERRRAELRARLIAALEPEPAGAMPFARIA